MTPSLIMPRSSKTSLPRSARMALIAATLLEKQFSAPLYSRPRASSEYLRSGSHISTASPAARTTAGSSQPLLFHTTGSLLRVLNSLSTGMSRFAHGVGVTRLMFSAPCFSRWSMSLRRSSPVTVTPAPPLDITLFWQKIQRMSQPEKKTVPLPPLPEMQGSSKK